MVFHLREVLLQFLLVVRLMEFGISILLPNASLIMLSVLSETLPTKRVHIIYLFIYLLRDAAKVAFQNNSLKTQTCTGVYI